MIIKQKAFIQIYDKTPSLTYNTLNLVVIDYWKHRLFLLNWGETHFYDENWTL